MFLSALVASTSVVEKTKPYNCAVGSQHLKYEDANTSNMCEQTWSIETDVSKHLSSDQLILVASLCILIALCLNKCVFHV